ncbi:MAG: transposase [Patescibacteria group bacterium]|nr:transposase [Patescibacteria group bacterium]
MGIPFLAVNARGTSSKCSICGDKMFAEENRKMYCSTCKTNIDRDDNASVNIMKRGLQKLFWTWFRSIGLPNEAMKGNPTTMVILRADGSQSSAPTLDEIRVAPRS